MKEHFFIVGAQRSGTTYLYNLLDQHPEICMSKPVRPEPKYFIGKEISEINYSDYFTKFFSDSMECKIYGEKSTTYYEQEDSARIISLFFPKAKIIFLLRNPVQRTLSNYHFSVENGLEKRSLSEVFLSDNIHLPPKPDNVSVNPFDYLARGEYSKYIKLYQKYFSATQIKIIIFEELSNNPALVKDIYSFLGVNESFSPENITKVVNASKRKLATPPQVIEKIRKYFIPHNRQLEQILKREIIQWK